jgi:hypothetical protein
MAKQTINIGTAANDGTGDPLRTAFTKTNANFTEIYNAGLIPSQTGNNARYLSTDGAILSWAVPFSGSYADLTNKPTLFSGSYNDLTNKPTIPETNTNTHGGSAAIVVGQQNATRDNLTVRIVNNTISHANNSLDVEFKYSDSSNNVSIAASMLSSTYGSGQGNILSGVVVVNANNTTYQLVGNLPAAGDTLSFLVSDLSFHKIYRVIVIARNTPAVGIAGDAYCVIEELK